MQFQVMVWAHSKWQKECRSNKERWRDQHAWRQKKPAWLIPCCGCCYFWYSNTETKNIILLSMALKFWCTYCRGTVGNMFLIAVARASTIASTSWLPASSPVKNEYILSPTVKLSCKKIHILNSKQVNCITLNPQNEKQHSHLHHLEIRILKLHILRNWQPYWHLYRWVFLLVCNSKQN